MFSLCARSGKRRFWDPNGFQGSTLAAEPITRMGLKGWGAGAALAADWGLYVTHVSRSSAGRDPPPLAFYCSKSEFPSLFRVGERLVDGTQCVEPLFLFAHSEGLW